MSVDVTSADRIVEQCLGLEHADDPPALGFAGARMTSAEVDNFEAVRRFGIGPDHVSVSAPHLVLGRILGSRWRPSENRMAGLFARIHEALGGGSWLIGRVTGSEYAKAQAYARHTDQTYPREPWFARRDAAAYGMALDAQGKIAWGGPTSAATRSSQCWAKRSPTRIWRGCVRTASPTFSPATGSSISGWRW